MKFLSKLFFVSLLSIVAVFSDNFQVNASENYPMEDEQDIDEKLLEYGYPQRLIDELSNISKRDILNDGITEYAGAKTITYDLNNNIISVDDYTDSNPPIVLYGQIKGMTVTQTAGRQVVPSSMDEFVLRSDYKWTTNPFFTGTDLIGFAWDGNKFNAVPNTSSVEVRKNGKVTHSSNNLYSSSFTGVGWAANLPDFGGPIVVTSKIRIREVKTLTGTSQFHSLYTHSLAGIGSMGLNFGVLSVSFTGTKSNDQRATFIDFNH
ncbi:hypothetical protein NYE67_02765 [Solibacillus sp. FSL W8-0474]|uniref:hypothetical protein n=1 Tax=Solibacillus sp. FSL W8-0474 TaxID=2975336 RepID=UPI0030FB9EA1